VRLITYVRPEGPRRRDGALLPSSATCPGPRPSGSARRTKTDTRGSDALGYDRNLHDYGAVVRLTVV
jgi:hypothetical protein